MPGHSADVEIGYSAKVKGTRDVDKLAEAMAGVDEQTPRGDLDVTAKVKGTRDVDTLSKSLDKLPNSTKVGVDLDVDTTRPLDQLADAVRKLPDTDKVTVDLAVTGAGDVDTLRTDLSKLPASTKVDVSVDADTAGVHKVKQSLDDVHQSAKDAHDETAGFASEVTGTLGSQFSEGSGLVADFAEQFRNLRDKVKESDDKIGTVAKAAAGIGGTLLAGFGIDAIIGVFGQMNEAAAVTEQNVKDLSAQIVESGGLIDAQFQKMQVQQIIEDPGFASLTKAGADYADTLDGLRGDTAALARVHDQLKTAADKSAESIRQAGGSEEQAQAQYQTVQTLDDMATKFDAAGQSAIKSGRDLQKYYVHAGLAEDKIGDVANGVDLLSAAMQDNAKDTSKATKEVFRFDQQPLNDKTSTIDADDKATPKAKAYNKVQINPKTGKLEAVDHASPKVDTYNRKPVDNKKSTLDATDYATGRLHAFNDSPIDDKTAVVDADTTQAKADIAALDGMKVTINALLNPLNDLTKFFFGSAGLGSFSAPAPDDLSAEPTGIPAAATAPAATRSTATVTAPVVININGTVIDPAGAARALQQVLTRANRRTRPLNRGGKYGVSRAPV